MKKRNIATVVIIVLALVLIVVGIIHILNAKKENQQPSVPYEKAQIGVTVDSWLKIVEIDEYYGRLAVVAENVSEDNVEYAVLTVKTKSETLSFNVSAVLSGAKVVLLCNEDVKSDPNEVYTTWQIKDKILYKNPPVMNDDIFELKVLDGSISIRNISEKDIESDIVIYYKDKKGELLNGSVTYKFRVDALAEGSQTYVKAPELNENNCQIIFTDYD
ncbi:MAG: hypothetical protein IKU08_08490 [Clostridia bacterium]|nr:hypothetical protein [Clostridia bacterium]